MTKLLTLLLLIGFFSVGCGPENPEKRYIFLIRQTRALLGKNRANPQTALQIIEKLLEESDIPAIRTQLEGLPPHHAMDSFRRIVAEHGRLEDLVMSHDNLVENEAILALLERLAP